MAALLSLPGRKPDRCSPPRPRRMRAAVPSAPPVIGARCQNPSTTRLCMILVVVHAFSPVVRVTGVRGKRDALGITRAELALMTGMTVDTLWEIEGGTTRPQHEQRVALMRALDAEFDELFTVSVISRSR